MRIKRSYLIAGSIAAAVALWLASGALDGGPETEQDTSEQADAADARPLPQVRVRTLVAQPHATDLVLFGRTEAERKVRIRAETAGRVVEQAVTKGQPVAVGDEIVRLAMDDRKARLDEAQALVAQRQIAYDAAMELSRKEFRSRVRLAEEKAELEAAQAYLAARRLDIDRTQMKAPFDGVVDELPAEVGDYLEVGDEVAMIADLDPIIIVGEATEREVTGLTAGTVADVRLATGERLDGAVRYVSRVGSAATRTFRLEVVVPNPDGAIPEGVTAEMVLSVGQQSAHRTTPAVLTLNDDGVVGVKAVDDDDRVTFWPVSLVSDTAEGVWLGGLPDRVRLITVGQEFVRAGQKVQPVPEDAPATDQAATPGAS